MVSNAWEIYKKDIHTVRTNSAVWITVVALCILPSLYAWINIKASWDPYASEATSRIKVAVVNNDEGAMLQTKAINMGEQVVTALESNNLLGWQFLKQEEAMQALRLGKVYAVVILPKSFSSDIVSLATNDIREAKIKYIVNEKLNAIAPKITSKGVSGIQTTVSQEVVKAVSETILEMAKELGIEIEDVVLPKLVEAGTILHDIESRFTNVNDLIETTEGGLYQFENVLHQAVERMPELEKLLIGVQEMIGSIDDFMRLSEAGLQKFAPTIKKDLTLLKEMSSELHRYAQGLSDLLTTDSEQALKMLENMLQRTKAMEQILSSLSRVLQGIQGITGTDDLQDVLARLEVVQDKLSEVRGNLEVVQQKMASNESPDQGLMGKVITLFEDMENIFTQLDEEAETVIMPKIQTIFNKVEIVTEEASKTVDGVKSDLPEVTNLLISAQEMIQKGEDTLGMVKEVLPQAEEKIIGLSHKIDEVNTNQRLKELITLIKEHVVQRSEFLANAAQIEEEVIFPMGNYGSQMTPFYSSLAAWVGLTILVSMIPVEAEGTYTSHEIYFGKLLTYLTLTLIQGLIIGLGDLWLLKIYCLRPWLFTLGILLIAITFTCIVYSLVSVFRNIGKVIAIILMILQVAGSGGTFPVQLTSDFFIHLNPYLPFTYAISLLREGIGGVVPRILYVDLIALSLFSIGSIILSIFLKKPMNKALQGFSQKVHEGGL